MIKITIVEDEQAIREMYKLRLASEGYSISLAEDGKMALEVLEKERPNLILLDIKMPRLPGHEVLRWVRSQEWGARTKVVVLTNISKSEAPADFRVLGVDHYIVKAHYTPSQVIRVIEEVLS